VAQRLVQKLEGETERWAPIPLAYHGGPW